MKTFMSYRNAVKGLAALALVFSIVSCGKKGGGGGGVVTPAGTGDCASDTSKCDVGHKYDAGYFLGAGTGEQQYGYDKYAKLYLAFFAKNKVSHDDDYIEYDGDVTANGTLNISTEQYGMLTNPAQKGRSVAGLTFYWDFSFGNGGSGYDDYDDYNYNYPSYQDPYYYYYPCTGSSGCGSCGSCGNGGDDYNDYPTECQLPKGTYKVATSSAGEWHSNGYYSSVSDLTLKITGQSKTIVATFSGSLENAGNYGDDEVGQLSGYLNFKTVNGKNCSIQVAF